MQNHLETLENHILVENIWLMKETTHKKLEVKRTLLNDYKYKDPLDNHLYNFHFHLSLK